MLPPANAPQAIGFLTHLWSPAIARHFRRLKAEAGKSLPVYLIYQPPEGVVVPPADMQPDVIVHQNDFMQGFPVRAREIDDSIANTGHVDLVWLKAFEDPVFASYDNIWMIESDVDFSGNWATFFEATTNYEGDLIAARIRRLSEDPWFWFAKTLRKPDTVSVDPIIAFFPIARISRRARDAYLEAISDPTWGGHYEILLPTVVEHAGLKVTDLGGHGPFTPPSRLGLHYEGRFDASRNDGSTHGFRPARGFDYFVDRAGAFRQPDRIYHPIKSEMSGQEKLRSNLRRLRRWRDRHLDALTGRKSLRSRLTD